MYVHLQNVTLIYLVHDSVTTCTRSKAGGTPSYKFKWQWSLTAYINIILQSNKPSQNWNDHHLDKAKYIEHTHLTSISVNTYNLFMSQSHWPHCYESRTFLDILINGLYLNFKQKSTVFESRKKKCIANNVRVVWYQLQPSALSYVVHLVASDKRLRHSEVRTSILSTTKGVNVIHFIIGQSALEALKVFLLLFN